MIILDDRDDVWQGHLPNLIHVSDYVFFRGFSDVNNPHGRNVLHTDGPKTTDTASEQPATESSNGKASSETEEPTNETQTKKSKDQEAREAQIGRMLDRDSKDIQLKSVLRVLTEVHRRFFDEYERRNHDISDLHVKDFLGEMRRKTLAGLNIVFSGIIPLEYRPQSHRVWRKAEEFGAKCSLDIRPETTHLVAEKKGTQKAQRARKRGDISVVRTTWLLESIQNFQRMPEANYLLYPSQGRNRDTQTSMEDADETTEKKEKGKGILDQTSKKRIVGEDQDQVSMFDNAVPSAKRHRTEQSSTREAEANGNGDNGEVANDDQPQQHLAVE